MHYLCNVIRKRIHCTSYQGLEKPALIVLSTQNQFSYSRRPLLYPYSYGRANEIIDILSGHPEKCLRKISANIGCSHTSPQWPRSRYFYSLNQVISMKTANGNRITIEQEINSIFHLLSNTAGENLSVGREKPAKGSSCKGIITVFSRAELRQQEDERYFKARAIARYVFYPDTLDPTRLGSVAIYGDNTAAWCHTLGKQSTLFGHRILSVQIEVGRRPFIDVRLDA